MFWRECFFTFHGKSPLDYLFGEYLLFTILSHLLSKSKYIIVLLCHLNWLVSSDNNPAPSIVYTIYTLDIQNPPVIPGEYRYLEPPKAFSSGDVWMYIGSYRGRWNSRRRHTTGNSKMVLFTQALYIQTTFMEGMNEPPKAISWGEGSWGFQIPILTRYDWIILDV